MSMATAIDDTELNISSYSITATILTPSTEDDYNITCKWNDWSPVIDWDALSPDYDDIHGLIQSVVDNGGLEPTPVTHETSDTMSVDEGTNSVDSDSKGLRLVHLLMAAAEALTGVNESYDLARVILIRLKELLSPNDGTNMERLAACFTDALYSLVDGAGGLHGKHLIGNGNHYNHLCDERHVLAAFQLLQDISPCVKFGHFTANQAILEAVAQDRRVHIVDYDIMEGIQWASLMQALVSRKDGPPVPHLRITALLRSKSRGSIGTVQETGRRLIAFAASIGQPFSFHHCRLDSDDTFRAAALKLVRGEALVINCMLNLPHFNYRAPDSIISFLSGVKTLSPRLVTLIEEVTGTIGDGGFVSQFMDSLHHYSAFYDSLEAGFPIPMKDQAWTLVERVFLGPRIAGSLSGIYQTGGRERCSWWEWLGSVGYKPASISSANHCQAKLLLGLFNDGYRLEELANNRLILGWKSRNFFSASIWTSSPESGY